MADTASAEMILDAAKQLSEMGDKVAAFAISSALLLTFASMKELSEWVKRERRSFLAGLAIGGCIYIAAVWSLYAFEMCTLNSMSAVDVTRLGDGLRVVKRVSGILAAARTLGIAASTLVGMLCDMGHE